MAFVQRTRALPRLLGMLLGSLALALTACGAPSAATAASSAATTVQVRVDPKLGTILADGKGMTLYKYGKDGTNTSACLAACATAWPPLTATGAATLPSGVAGTLATFARSDGVTQVSFNGVPLYRYSKDQKSGDTVGDGIGGVWSVANVANTRTAPAATAVPATRVSGTIQGVDNGKVTLA
ncbi:MAG TPA: hypothetical protein VGP33_17435, partial [Chloroflexota bacterium]|nr:hypothetical protein [Chloroflexota bacterium]